MQQYAHHVSRCPRACWSKRQGASEPPQAGATKAAQLASTGCMLACFLQRCCENNLGIARSGTIASHVGSPCQRTPPPSPFFLGLFSSTLRPPTYSGRLRALRPPCRALRAAREATAACCGQRQRGRGRYRCRWAEPLPLCPCRPPSRAPCMHAASAEGTPAAAAAAAAWEEAAASSCTLSAAGAGASDASDATGLMYSSVHGEKTAGHGRGGGLLSLAD